MVTIRLARGGRVHRPVYTIVAADSRKSRDGKFLERLGKYDPHAETVFSAVETDKIKQWVTNGAQVSPALKSLFKKNNVTL